MYYAFGPYRLDTQRYELAQDGVPIPLRPSMFTRLCMLNWNARIGIFNGMLRRPLGPPLPRPPAPVMGRLASAGREDAPLHVGYTPLDSPCVWQNNEATGHAGQAEEGLRLLAKALTAFEVTGQGDGLVEAYCLQGELLLKAEGRVRKAALTAEECFQQALAIARRQQATSWELRVALSLSRLCQHQGKREEAYDLRAPVYNWFTAGFDTADLHEAGILLAALAEGQP
jgi:hypothetical protein